MRDTAPYKPPRTPPMSDNNWASWWPCRHCRCQTYRIARLLGSAGFVTMSSEWPIPCQRSKRDTAGAVTT